MSFLAAQKIPVLSEICKFHRYTHTLLHKQQTLAKKRTGEGGGYPPRTRRGRSSAPVNPYATGRQCYYYLLETGHDGRRRQRADASGHVM